jgi:hypothetical protein
MLTGLLAACSSKTVEPPGPPTALPACMAKESKPVVFTTLGTVAAGICVRVRGLSVNGLLYENGATYQLWQKTPDKVLSVTLRWTPSEPAALKSHPQFVELVGRVGKCPAKADCTRALAVDSYTIIPTAMD